MHTWTSSPFASTAGNRAVGECSSIACWKMPSQHSQRDIGLQEPTKQHQNTTCSGYCTKAATPHLQFSSRFAMIHRCVQGKSLDCHKHHGFWVCSSGLVDRTS